MQRQTERTTPHRQYIASYEDAVTRRSINHNPFEEPMIFSGLGAELMGGSHYIQETVDKFDKIQYHRGMPLPDLRFHPDTLAVGENHLKTIYVPESRDVRSRVQEEEVEDTEDNKVLDRLFSGGRRRKGKK
jgi:hypothetical protein